MNVAITYNVECIGFVCHGFEPFMFGIFSLHFANALLAAVTVNYMALDLEKMKTKIRTEVLNLTLDTWQKIKQITVNGQIEVTPKELIDLIGFDGGQFLSGKLNDEERIFVDSYYKLGRALEKQTDV